MTFKSLLFFLGLTTLRGCPERHTTSYNGTNDTSYQITTNMAGETLFIKTKVKGISNGQFRAYYQRNKLWNLSFYVNGKLQGESYTYTYGGNLAELNVWKDSRLWEKKVFWQSIPYTDGKKFYHLSDTGIYTIKDGLMVYDLDSHPPEGLIISMHDENAQEIYYVYRNGKMKLYPKPNKR